MYRGNKIIFLKNDFSRLKKFIKMYEKFNLLIKKNKLSEYLIGKHFFNCFINIFSTIIFNNKTNFI